MTFDTFNPKLKKVAEAGLSFCKSRYGRNSLRIHQEIHGNISWKPTFYLKPNRNLILAVEVDEVLYPQIFKEAAEDIKLYDIPIQVFLICPLDVYLKDTKQAVVNQLKKRGFGLITVDDDGNVAQQCPCIPLAQHISEQELDGEVQGLTPKLKTTFKSAHATYQINEGQGLQEAGQIVEAIINSMAKESVRLGFGNGLLRGATADTIDALYELRQLRDQRAALGGARDFVKEYRNKASHAPRTAREAMEKIRKCRAGFLDAIRVSKNLHTAMKAKQFRLTIHLT
jgi:hypothetical protein